MLDALGALLLIAAASIPPVVPPASLDAVLQAAMSSGRAGTVRVIVRARPDRAGELDAAVTSAGGTLLHRYDFIHAVSAQIDLQRVPTLQGHPAVASLSSDGAIEPMRR